MNNENRLPLELSNIRRAKSNRLVTDDRTPDIQEELNQEAEHRPLLQSVQSSQSSQSSQARTQNRMISQPIIQHNPQLPNSFLKLLQFDTIYSKFDIIAQNKSTPPMNWGNIARILKWVFITRLVVILLVAFSPLLIGRAPTDADYQHIQDQWIPSLLFGQHPTPQTQLKQTQHTSETLIDHPFIALQSPIEYNDALFTHKPTLSTFFDTFPSVRDKLSTCSSLGFEIIPKEQREILDASFITQFSGNVNSDSSHIPPHISSHTSVISLLLSKLQVAVIYPSALLIGFSSWDAALNLEIAQFGYHTEKMHAFFPLFPYFVRQIASLLSRLSIFQTWCIRPLLIFSSILLNILLFPATALAIYALSLRVIRHEGIATISAILFSCNPASVFFTVAYTECLFAFLCIVGLLSLANGHGSTAMKISRQNTFSTILWKIIFWCRTFILRWVAVLLFMLASFTRSNGAVMFGFLLLEPAREAICWISKLVKCNNSKQVEETKFYRNNDGNGIGNGNWNAEAYENGSNNNHNNRNNSNSEVQGRKSRKNTSTPANLPRNPCSSVGRYIFSIVFFLFSFTNLIIQCSFAIFPSASLQMFAYSIHCSPWNTTLTANIYQNATINRNLYPFPYVTSPPPYCEASSSKLISFSSDENKNSLHFLIDQTNEYHNHIDTLSPLQALLYIPLNAIFETIHDFYPIQTYLVGPTTALQHEKVLSTRYIEAQKSDANPTSLISNRYPDIFTLKNTNNDSYTVNILTLSSIPPVYSSLQDRFWNLGFLKYYTPQQIPNFLLAFPMILSVFFLIKQMFLTRLYTPGVRLVNRIDKSTRYGSCGDKLIWGWNRFFDILVVFLGPPSSNAQIGSTLIYNFNDTIENNLLLQLPRNINERNRQTETVDQLSASYPLSMPDTVVHSCQILFLWIFALSFMHIQVITRFLAGSPVLYWFLAKYFVHKTPPQLNQKQQENVQLQQQRTKNRNVIVVWCVLYIILGCIMFSTFLPWT